MCENIRRVNDCEGAAIWKCISGVGTNAKSPHRRGEAERERASSSSSHQQHQANECSVVTLFTSCQLFLVSAVSWLLILRTRRARTGFAVAARTIQFALSTSPWFKAAEEETWLLFIVRLINWLLHCVGRCEVVNTDFVRTFVPLSDIHVRFSSGVGGWWVLEGGVAFDWWKMDQIDSDFYVEVFIKVRSRRMKRFLSCEWMRFVGWWGTVRCDVLCRNR